MASEKTVQIHIDSHLWIDTVDLPDEVVSQLEEELTIPNLARENARDRMIQGWQDMDPFIDMYAREGEYLIAPRGFASQLAEGMETLGIQIEWVDQRTRPEEFFDEADEIPARPYQRKLIEALQEAEQGIAKAPTGSGKTVAILELIRRVGGPALIIVNTKEIADQWVTRISEWLGYEGTGFIGDGEFRVDDYITVAINATLWSRNEKLLFDGFFQKFGLVCLDECHHATAETYKHVMNQFHATYRFGVSATPEKTGDFTLAEMVIGPQVVEVTEEDVEDAILKPQVKVIATDFGAVYKGDKLMPDGWVKRNNYSTILKRLTEDQKRNQLIAQEIIDHHWYNANLVLSKRIKHMEILADALIAEGFPYDDLFTIIGNDSREERRAVVARTEAARCVVFSTLADEALDAPRLDRAHLVFPTRNPDLVRQQIGRIRRKHPDKKDAMVIDYRDFQVKPMEAQYMVRRHEVYDPIGLEVVKV